MMLKATHTSLSTELMVRLIWVNARPPAPPGPELGNDAMSPLFQAVIEATEEAIYNSLFMATPVTSKGRTVQPLPLERVLAILKRYGIGEN